MTRYAVDGIFLTQKSTGTQRYSYEILKELDKKLNGLDVEIVVPDWYAVSFQYENIKFVKFGRLKGIAWEQLDFSRYLIQSRRQGIFLNNVYSLLVPGGIIAIHDVCYKARPEFYESLRDKVSMMWHRLNYWGAAHSKMKIITVSEFSKSEIEKFYKVDGKRITIVHSSWQHMKQIKESSAAFEKYPQLKKGNYYFTLSTLGANKNFKWILYAAKNNPDENFAIAGGGQLKGAAEAEGLVNLPNVNFLGYIDDADIKALMHYCKGFLFPTFYEGFGLTPLEAAACGAGNIIVSDTPCMHEIYGSYVTYIDPYDYSCHIPEKKVEIDAKALLDKYSFKDSADKLKKLMYGKDNG